MGNDDDGGWLVDEAQRRAMRTDAPHESRGALHLGQTLNTATVTRAAQHVTLTVDLPGNAADIIAAAMALQTALRVQRDPLTTDAAAAAEAAVFALARFGAFDSTANVLASGIAARVRSLGGTVASDIPGSTVVAVSNDVFARLDGAVAAVEQHVDALVAAPQTEAIAAAAPTLTALLREGADATPRGLRGEDLRTVGAAHARVRGALGLLDQAAHTNGIAIAPARLDDVYAAEDALYLAGGGHAVNRRAAFYADSAEGGDGKTGGELVDAIVGWVQDGAVRQMVGLEAMREIVKEPIAVREPALLEEVITHAAQSFVGLIPGYLSGLLGSAVSAMWDPPEVSPRMKRPKVEAHAEGVKAPPILDFNVHDRREISAVWEATEGIREAFEVKKTVTAPATKIVDAIAPGEALHSGGAMLADMFISVLTGQLLTSANAVRERATPLRHALELVPPSGLAQMWHSLRVGTIATAQRAQEDLLMRWMTVVSAATNQQDPDGTSAHGGTLRGAFEQPGAVRINATVRVGDGPPRIEMTSANLGGLSEHGLSVLKEAKRSLGVAAMQRVVYVTLVERDGISKPIGSFDVAPDGALDLHNISPIDLTKAVHGGAASMLSTWDLSDAFTGGTDVKARQGAHAVLAALGTTAEIEGP